MNKNITVIGILALVIIFLGIFSACTNEVQPPEFPDNQMTDNQTVTPPDNETATGGTKISDDGRAVCNKEDNCCRTNADCTYAWYTGGCYVGEYINKVQKEAREQGTNIGEAPSREGVTCTCELNKCVTHG
jgi:hypothetical protein